MSLLKYSSFRELLSTENIKAETFDTNLDAMESVELMAMTVDLGDQVLAMARDRQISEDAAQALLMDLTKCFSNPKAHAQRVLQIAKELRGNRK